MGDSLPGLQARLMSQAMRKLTAVVHNTGCTLIFINQIRYKIGVMFGCFHYDTLVNFTDGRSLPIGKVVDEQIKGNVYCFNPDTEEIETKPITDWHDNGKVTNQDEFIHIQTESIDGRGRFGFTCTPNHKVLTDKGWKEACVLSYQDKLISKYTETVNGKYEDFIRGCLIGDSHISLRTTNTASLRLQNNENTEYMNWKLDKLTPFINFTERSIPKRGYRYDSDYSYEWAKIKRDLGNRDPLYMLSYYSHLGMALWIMDDGHLDLQNSHCRYIISMKRYRNNQDKLREITERLKQLGFHCNYNNRDGSIAFGKDVSMSIAAHIKKYVPECMQYKLPEELRGDYEKFELFNHPKLQIDTVCIKEIRPASSRQMRNKRKFDISVEGNHNYMVGGKHNGVIVHNSPETTSGGNALKFYASQRLDIRRIGSIKNKEAIIGNRTKVKIVKNKLAPPFKIAEFDIRFGIGIDRAGEVIDLGIEDGIVKKSGSWFSLSDGTKVGQGRDNAVQFMKDNPKITKKIRKELLENRGLDDSSPEEKTDGQTDEAEEVQGNTSGPAVDIHG
jgi:recombination protein RecA